MEKRVYRKNSALLYEEHFFHYSSILSTLFINIISSIISAIAYIIITTAVNITIDDVLLNITSIPANNEIIERIYIYFFEKRKYDKIRTKILGGFYYEESKNSSYSRPSF